jgi:hypothetical protein
MPKQRGKKKEKDTTEKKDPQPKSESKGGVNSKKETKTADNKSSLELKTTNLTPTASPGSSGAASPSLPATPSLTPGRLLPVNEPTPENTPRRLGQNKPTAPFFQVQLTDEEKAKAAQIAAQKEIELKENEIRKRDSAERYRQSSKQQALQLADKKLKLDPKQFNRDKLKEQAAAEDRRRTLIRENIKKQTAQNSDLALKLVVLVWLVIVLGIFYHVYSTIQLGRVANPPPVYRHTGYSSARSS